MAKCKIKAEDVKEVIISHMHLDHAGNPERDSNGDAAYCCKLDYAKIRVQELKSHNLGKKSPQSGLGVDQNVAP